MTWQLRFFVQLKLPFDDDDYEEEEKNLVLFQLILKIKQMLFCLGH